MFCRCVCFSLSRTRSHTRCGFPLLAPFASASFSVMRTSPFRGATWNVEPVLDATASINAPYRFDTASPQFNKLLSVVNCCRAF